MFFKKFFIPVTAAFTALLLLVPVTGHAATQNDVIKAAKSAGVSDFYINEGLTHADEYTSKQYDEMIRQINNYKKTVNTYLAKYFGGNPDDYSSSNKKREADTKFVSMSMDEKVEYVQKMSDSKRKNFIETMTTSERNSVVKQLSVSELTEILTPLTKFAQSLGFNVTVDSIIDGTISMSIRDKDGNLIDVSTVGTVIDNVGYDYRPLVFTSATAILIAIGGIAFISVKIGKSKRKESI